MHVGAAKKAGLDEAGPEEETQCDGIFSERSVPANFVYGKGMML